MTAINESVTTLENSKNSLRWFDGLGYGTLYDEPPVPYDVEYFHRYQEMDYTPMGESLTRARVELVKRYVSTMDTICDIGVGGGRFVQDMNASHAGFVYGFDINGAAVNWLKKCYYYLDPQSDDGPVSALTFWDSLEHMRIEDATQLLGTALDHVFVSMPIYTDVVHAMNSKHFKPGEHLLYFTHHGFVQFMRREGFTLIEWNEDETKLGREGIQSFAFRRTRWV